MTNLCRRRAVYAELAQKSKPKAVEITHGEEKGREEAAAAEVLVLDPQVFKKTSRKRVRRKAT